MDLLSMTVGAVAGGALFGGLWWYSAGQHARAVRAYERQFDAVNVSWRHDYNRVLRKLHTLRANCFITNERGHRVRYIDASPARRAKAETEN